MQSSNKFSFRMFSVVLFALIQTLTFVRTKENDMHLVHLANAQHALRVHRTAFTFEQMVVHLAIRQEFFSEWVD